MTTRDMNNNEAIQMLNRCKHEITQLRETVNYLKPKADAYDNISTIIRIFFVQPQGFASDDLVRIIQKRIDEMTPKPETNPIRTPTEKQAFDPDPCSPKDVVEANKRPSKPNLDELNRMKAQANSIQQFDIDKQDTPDAQPTARGYTDA